MITAAFIQRLAEDFESDPEAWKNPTVGTHLDALPAGSGTPTGWAKNMIRLRPDLWLDLQAPT